MVSSCMDRFVDELFADLRKSGYQARIVSIDHLALLQREIDRSVNRTYDGKSYKKEEGVIVR